MTDSLPIEFTFSIPKSEKANNTGIGEREINIPDVSTIPSIYDARLAPFLNTNEPPKSTDLYFLNTSLEDARFICSNLDEGILFIQHALEEIRSAQTGITTIINQHRAVLSPLRSIPDDILLTIFQWCSFSDTQGVDSLSSSRAPWTLSHVSGRWRTLAISSPCLWSNIDIVPRRIDTSTPHERDRMVFKVNLYLRHSAESDLFVNVYARHTAFFDEIFPILLRTATRWKSLSFTVNNSASPLRLSECCFKRLTKLKIFFWDDVPDGCRYTWNMPNLWNLSFSGCRLPTIDLPWERITSYACDENGLCHLPKLSALEHFSLAVSTFNVAFQMLTSLGVSFPLTLPTVRSLSMWQHFRDTDYINSTSDFLLLPSLTTLTINMSHQYWKFPRFNDSIRHLQNLSMISCDNSHPSDTVELRSFLTECISVNAIYLDMTGSQEEILHILADDHTLLKLTSLRVAMQSMWDHPGLVLDLVESRCQSVNVAHLTEIRIVEIENMRKGKWTQADTVTEDILERWNAVCSKVNVLTVFEHSFS